MITKCSIRGAIWLTLALGVIPLAFGQPYQMTFSVDFQGPTVGGPGPFSGAPASWFPAGVPIDEGQILTPGIPGPPGPNTPLPGPLPLPGVMVTSVPSGAGSIPGGLGVLPGVWDAVEVDAISYGRDRGDVLYFSVDEWASGDPFFPPASPYGLPNALKEGAIGASEASADVFRFLGPMPVGPMFPPAPPPQPGPGNLDFYDGDGVFPPGVFGVGLREPNPPGPGPDLGDNLDAVDLLSTFNDVAGRLYFSLDSDFPDPLEGLYPPINSGTAVGNGFAGGDVLLTFPGSGISPFIYAPANALGLDMFGRDTDDLDALAVLDAGVINEFEPGIDTILFSVRRGSAVIGQPDSNTGIPIEEGDILTIPAPFGLPFPAMVMPAEMMGLATRRSGTNIGPAFPFGDELDALDVTFQNNGDFVGTPAYDCLDVDALVAAIVAGGPVSTFDLNGDGVLDRSDLDVWLVEAGANNLGPGKAYLPADATLDGVVDGQDFIRWNMNKFTATAAFCKGDFNADGVVDGQDFIIWNQFKFQSSDTLLLTVPSLVPEPSGFVALIVMACLLVPMYRRHLMT